MKSFATSRLVRLSVLAATLAFVPAFVRAENADRALTLLQTNGVVGVKVVNGAISVGTYQMDVSQRLGRPSAKLADGSWLYPNYTVNESEATGTLRVAFIKGRVTDMTLLTPVVVTALESSAKENGNLAQLGHQSRR